MNQQGGQGGPPPGGGQPHAGHGQHPHPGQPQHAGYGQHPHPGQPPHPGHGPYVHPGQPPAGYGQHPHPGHPQHAGHGQLPHPGYPPHVGQGQHPYYGHPGPFVRAQYEFNQHENKIINDLAFWSGGLGIVKLVHGALSLFVANLFGLLLHLAVGLLMLQANRGLRKVVTTEGNDIDHLLKSVEQLATVFQIRLILTLMVTILAGIVAAVALSA